jgi:hypothetical protein
MTAITTSSSMSVKPRRVGADPCDAAGLLTPFTVCLGKPDPRHGYGGGGSRLVQEFSSPMF